MDPDSDTEIELAIDSTLDTMDTDLASVDTPAHSATTAPIVQHPPTLVSPAMPPAVADSVSNFAIPPTPHMVDDLTAIQEMVARGDVVGALPPISMSAAEKRRLVEASMAKARAQKATTGESSAAAGPADPSSASAPSELQSTRTADADIDSDSSSEFESSSEEESDSDAEPKPKKLKEHKSLTEAEHAEIKAEIDHMTGTIGGLADNDDDESSSEDESDDDDGAAGMLDNLGLEFMDDSEDEGGDVGTGIISTHEQPLPAVPPPPVQVLPEGMDIIIAGDVFSWMKDRGVETWRAKQETAESQPDLTDDKSEVKKDGSEPTASAPSDQDAVQLEAMTEPTNSLGPADNNIKTEATEPTSSIPTDVAAEAPEVKDVPATTPVPDASPAKPSMPKFNSAGTLVVQAMQAPGQGWLEEGSVICLSDRRVLGTVFETFGPLTSPFYAIRLPPPPYPYPSEEDVAKGTRVYFPAANQYRKFVDMHAVRDPRFRSDASNVYDEEVGEEEMEWSDDETEAAAKRARKQKRRASRAPAGPSGAGGPAGLPPRPHFDYSRDDDMGSLHGDDGAADWEGASDAGSTMSTVSQRALVSYDDVSPGPPAGRSATSGRGRGKDRSRGGRGGGGRGGGGSSGRGRGQGRSTGGGRPNHPLPPRPVPNWQAPNVDPIGAGFQQQQGYQPYQPAGYSPVQPGLGMPNMGMNMGMSMGMMAPMGMGMEMGMGMGMGGMPEGMGFQPRPPPPQQQQQQQSGGNAPAINPRFAAMMGMTGLPMGTGYWGQPGQEGMPGQGGHGMAGQGDGQWPSE